ncbi:hypothetical protein MACK_000562 [Theileria orientalis]|uniref:Uncharacterized protein n=1 Tax=Theileria orientalis TaxID=68886 RepID=A0A976QTA5_THEOR|nr:hypothetical protein MACK_000562 [Theileria orientalis]
MFDKSVLITGCDSGIGFGLCKRLVERGFYIIAICRTEIGKNNIEEALVNFKNKENAGNKDEVDQDKHSEHTATEDLGIVTILDITCEKSIKQLVSTYVELNKANKIPDLYAIINNAGIWRFSTLEECLVNDARIHEELERWKSVINTNVLGSVTTSLYFMPLLRVYKGLKPRVIFISSILGECAIPGQCSYISSKFAIRGFHESLFHELVNNNIFSICISPGPIRNTNLFSDLDDYEADQSYKCEHTKAIKDSLRKLRNYGSSVDKVVAAVICALESKRPKKHTNSAGTFAFRMAKLLPKVIYINSAPNRLLFGLQGH